MTTSNQFQNFYFDLLRSKQSPLLVEVSYQDLEKIAPTQSGGRKLTVPILAAQSVFNRRNDNHILVVDGDGVYTDSGFYLLDTLLNQLTDDFKSIKTINTLKESLKTAAAFGSGGMLNDLVGDYLDKGLDFLFDEIGGEFSGLLSNILIDSLDISKQVSAGIEDLVHDAVSDNVSDILANIGKQRITLSSQAKSELNRLSNAFASSESIDVFQLAFKLFIAIAIGQPKLIYVNNPHKLDHNSLALLSLIFSFAKHLKDNDKHLGLSCMFVYSDDEFSLYGEVANEHLEAQQMITTLCRFAQRYAMLERPSSDIPTIAVKSSVFIGRKDEIALLNQSFNSRTHIQLNVISGEPGIGKTALVNQHLAYIRKSSNAVVLSIFNESGKNSNATGLGSLEKSILDEEKRLMLQKTWQDKGRSFAKNIVSKRTIFKAAGILFSGGDKALSAIDAGLERLNITNDLDHFKQLGFSNFNQLNISERDKQFKKLDQAIKVLQSITSGEKPIVLFIDDLQWIDESASQYVLTHLSRFNDVYIVATLRPSDAATQVINWYKNKVQHRYSLAMLSLAEVAGSAEVEPIVDLSSYHLNRIDLEGFDKQSVIQLIQRVISGDNEQLVLLAESIIEQLAETTGDRVNTLFVIESINMLCDDKLYSENTFDRLILSNPLRLNPKVKNLRVSLSMTFKALRNKYQQSLMHANDKSTGLRFNLMAYAVLEERLYLLKLYFGERGNAAVNTLLFSSLLGTPFSSGLVKDVIQGIANTDVVELQGLRKHIVSGQCYTHLLPEHYAIVDEVYEILKRHQGIDHRYGYRHGLLHLFLEKQLDYLLQSLGDVKAIFIDFVYELVTDLQRQHPTYDIALAKLTDGERHIVESYHFAVSNVLKKGYELDQFYWGEVYTDSLRSLSSFYSSVGEQDKVLDVEGTILANVEMFFHQPGEIWLSYYVDSVIACTNVERDKGNLADALRMQQGVYESLLDDFEHAKKELRASSLELLKALASTCLEAGDLEQSIKYANELIDSLGEYHPSDKTVYLRLHTLVIIGSCYKKQGRFVDASEIYDGCLAILVEQENSEVELWNQYYIAILRQLSSCNRQLGQFEVAYRYIGEAKLQVEQCYHRDGDTYAGAYIETLFELASYCTCVEDTTQCLVTLDMAHNVIMEQYERDYSQWTIALVGNYMQRAWLYDQLNQFDDTISVLHRCLAVAKRLFDSNADKGAETYITTLEFIEYQHSKNEDYDAAVRTVELIIAYYREQYELSPQDGLCEYIKRLDSLRLIYCNAEQYQQAIEIMERALALFDAHQAELSSDDVDAYLSCIESLCGTLLSFDSLQGQAIAKQALIAFRPYLESQQMQFGERYLKASSELGLCYYGMDDFVNAYDVYHDAVLISSELYNDDPDSFCTIHHEILNVYAVLLLDLERFEESYEAHKRWITVFSAQKCDSVDSFVYPFIRLVSLHQEVGSADIDFDAQSLAEQLIVDAYQQFGEQLLADLGNIYDDGSEHGLIHLRNSDVEEDVQVYSIFKRYFCEPIGII